MRVVSRNWKGGVISRLRFELGVRIGSSAGAGWGRASEPLSDGSAGGLKLIRALPVKEPDLISRAVNGREICGTSLGLVAASTSGTKRGVPFRLQSANPFWGGSCSRFISVWRTPKGPQESVQDAVHGCVFLSVRRLSLGNQNGRPNHEL